MKAKPKAKARTGKLDAAKIAPVIGVIPRWRLLQLLDETAANVHNWTRLGVVVRVKVGEYDGDQTVLNIVRAWKGTRNSRLQQEGFDPVEERYRAQKAQREISELRLNVMSGRLIPVDDVKTLWAEVLVAVRQAVLSIPSRCAAELPHLTAHDRSIIERECRSALDQNQLKERPPLPRPKE